MQVGIQDLTTVLIQWFKVESIMLHHINYFFFHIFEILSFLAIRLDFGHHAIEILADHLCHLKQHWFELFESGFVKTEVEKVQDDPSF